MEDSDNEYMMEGNPDDEQTPIEGMHEDEEDDNDDMDDAELSDLDEYLELIEESDQDELTTEDVQLIESSLDGGSILTVCTEMKDDANNDFNNENYVRARHTYVRVLTMLNLSRHLGVGFDLEVLTLLITCLLNLSACSLKMEKYNEAFIHANRAVDLIEREKTSPSMAPVRHTVTNWDPLHIKGLFRKGQALYHLDDRDSALKVLLVAASIDENNRPVNNLLRKIEKEMNKEEQGSDSQSDEPSLRGTKRGFEGMFHRLKEKELKVEQTRIESAKQIQRDLLSSGSFGGSYQQIDPVLGLRARELQTSTFRRSQLINIAYRYIPTSAPKKINFGNTRIYCGQYSNDGNMFISASQDWYVRIYNSSRGKFKIHKKLLATGHHVNWTLTDATLSNDNSMLIYSSITPFVHLFKIDEETTHQDLLNFSSSSRFGIWSLRFSADSREIIAGTSDNSLYVFNIERRDVEKYRAHKDEVNAVCFADTDSSHVALTGSDDSNIFVWDRRSSTGKPESALLGHTEGITYISSKGDGRYIISNGKDQKIKLWDLRKTLPFSSVQNAPKPTRRSDWDYRYGSYPSDPKSVVHPADNSVQTFVSHDVLQTLIRCHFSPMYNTGQRYIYSGSADGRVVIYDLSSSVVQTLQTSSSIVRDVSWHPTQNNIVASSFDGKLYKFNYDE